MSEKICMVTGANRGIGKAIALGLAQHGATVAMVCRNRQNGEQAQAEIRSATGNPDVNLMIADLASLESVRQLAKHYCPLFRPFGIRLDAKYCQRFGCTGIAESMDHAGWFYWLWLAAQSWLRPKIHCRPQDPLLGYSNHDLRVGSAGNRFFQHQAFYRWCGLFRARKQFTLSLRSNCRSLFHHRHSLSARDCANPQ